MPGICDSITKQAIKAKGCGEESSINRHPCAAIAAGHNKGVVGIGRVQDTKACVLRVFAYHDVQQNQVWQVLNSASKKDKDLEWSYT
jgi:hypothetical protein